VAKQPAPKILVVRCQCGFEARGTLTKLVPIVQRHGRDIHKMETSPEQVAVMAHPA
jgi:predicted small metal-binding protein